MIEVFANGMKFSMWTSATVSRSVGNIAASFSLSVSYRDLDGGKLQLFPGDLIEIDVDKIPVIKGFVVNISASYSSSSHDVTVSGYETTCDLADCSVEAPYEWKNSKIDRIIYDICGRLGIKFENKMGVDCGDPLKNFGIGPGTKAVDAIADLCKTRGILPCSDGMGKVFLLKPSSAKHAERNIVEGVNIVSASMRLSVSERYSDYYVYGSGKKMVKASSKDDKIERKRPLIIVDSNSTDKASAEARAYWESSVRKSRSFSLTCTLQGWKSSANSIWNSGEIVFVLSPSVFIEDSSELLISKVVFRYDRNNGSFTEVELVQPESFEPQPESKKISGTVFRPQKTDVWKTIEKAVKG